MVPNGRLEPWLWFWCRLAGMNHGYSLQDIDGLSVAIVVMKPAGRRNPYVVVGVEPRGPRDSVAVGGWVPQTWSVAPIQGAMRGGRTKE